MFIERIKDVCCICGNPIGGTGYRYDTWGRKCHLTHYTSTCRSCGRIVPVGHQFCASCRKSCVTSENQLRVQFIYSEVKNRLAVMGIHLPKDNLTISIVDRQKLNSLLNCGSADNFDGLTISKVSFSGKSHQIYLLESLPTIRYKTVLAHECGHVFLNEHDSVLNRGHIREVEGFCQLVAYKVLLFDDTKESEIMRSNLLQSQDPIYGEGFRVMKRREEQLGWTRMLANYS